MKKFLVVKADFNDADYITEINEISDTDIKKIMPIIEAINKIGDRHNWANDINTDISDLKELFPDVPRKIIDKFEEYVPYNSESGYGPHSIESIRILTVEDDKELIIK